MTELIVIDENEKLSYCEMCKIVINKIENRLTLFPNNNETDFVAINFVDKCYQKNNLLSLFPSKELKKKIVLNFSNSGTCEKVYNLIQSNEADENELLKKVFHIQVFVPILDEIKSNTFANPRLTEIINDFINSLEDKEKQPFLDAINETKLDSLFDNLNSNNAIATEGTEVTRVSSSNILLSNLNTPPNINEVFKSISPLKSNLVKEVDSERRLSLRKRPLINNISYCENGKNDDLENLEGRIDDEIDSPESNENDSAIKRRKLPSKCSNNAFEKILPLNLYEIIIFEIYGQLKTRLIVFLSTDKKLCYEYSCGNNQKYFVCCGCDIQTPRKFVAAIKSLDDDGVECIKLNGAEHVCKPIEYNPEKFKDDIKVYSPNYQLLKYARYGLENEYLIIFTSNEKKYCYEFCYNRKKKKGNCIKCQQKGHCLPASICIDENGKEYVSQKNIKHVCEPILYNQEKYKDQEIIKAPYFKLFEKRSQGKMVHKLAIFYGDNKELCYEYSKFNENLYQCFKCLNVNRKHYVFAKLIKIDGNETHVQLSKVKHICELQKYIPEKPVPFIRKPNFKVEIIRKHFGVLRKQLIVFIQDDQNLCYIYASHGGKTYICSECKKLKKYAAAIIRVDENSEEFVELFNTEHACKPQKYVPSNDDDVKKISSLDINKRWKELKKGPITSEMIKPEKLIKKPNFVIDCFSKDNVTIVKQLIIFDISNSNLSYIYGFKTRNQVYDCIGCRAKGKYVCAKFNETENPDDSFIALGKANHVCEPQPNEKMMQTDEFKIKKCEKGNISKVIILNSENKNLCYEFRLYRDNRFRCHGCFIKNRKFVYQGNIYENENKEYYFKLGNYQHICKPIKYSN